MRKLKRRSRRRGEKERGATKKGQKAKIYGERDKKTDLRKVKMRK